MNCHLQIYATNLRSGYWKLFFCTSSFFFRSNISAFQQMNITICAIYIYVIKFWTKAQLNKSDILGGMEIISQRKCSGITKYINSHMPALLHSPQIKNTHQHIQAFLITQKSRIPNRISSSPKKFSSIKN